MSNDVEKNCPIKKIRINCNMLIISFSNSILISIICIIYLVKMKIIMNVKLVFLSPPFMGCSQEKLMTYAITFSISPQFSGPSNVSTEASNRPSKASDKFSKAIHKFKTEIQNQDNDYTIIYSLQVEYY